MNWFILTLACIILWGVADILYKVSMDYNDSLSHYKNFVWIGIIMALVGCVMSTWSNTLLDSLKMVKNDVLYLVPLYFTHAIALFIGLQGIKHLSASVVAPLENIDGAIATIIIYFYYLLTDHIHPSYGIGIMNVIATVSIIIGVILLGRQEQALMRQEAHLPEERKKHRLGALALFFPIIYNLVDGFLIAEINGINGNSGIVTQGAEGSIPAIDFFIFECFAFAVVAIGVWLYMLIVKKYAYNPFQDEELIRSGAAIGETGGTMTFIFASAINPRLTAPVVSSYCLVTIVLARIFLKERLTRKQYLSLAFVVVGIALLSISEFLNA